ncbi:MAG: ABC transporter ATP-binding protein [Methylacidiphilales bacterium]|nr:ABC transporter ATP-binding protein [Candidatus Methylacidiphilales bacterium]
MAEAAIRFDRVTRRFGRLAAVQGLTLEIPRGSIYALLGPNGSGKTTIIKMVVNLLCPSEGRICVLGTDSKSLFAGDFERIGYVSENQEIPEWMTAREYWDFLRPFYSRWDEVYVEALARQMDVPLHTAIKRLSRGMRGKVSLISSIAYRPELLILDEPFSGLDPLVRDEVVESLLAATREHRWTIFISSHDIDEVDRFATHVGILDEGRLVVGGTKEEVKAQMPEATLKEIFLKHARTFRDAKRNKRL